MIPYTVTVLVLLAARVAAQADFASPSWEYSGCVNIGNIAFEHTANFVDPFTPQQCQSACNGYGFAAAFVELCLCGNSVGDISSLKLEDGACNNPCQGDVKLGFCGHMDADGSYANVYAVCSDHPSYGSPSTVPALPPFEIPSVTIPPLSTPCDLSTTLTLSTTSICSDELEIPDLTPTGFSTPPDLVPLATTESALGLGFGPSSAGLPPGEYGWSSTSSPCSNDNVSGTTFVIVVSPGLPSTSTPCSEDDPSPSTTPDAQPPSIYYSDVPTESTATDSYPNPSVSDGSQSILVSLLQTSTPISATELSTAPGDSTVPGGATPTTSGPAIITAGGPHNSYNSWAVLLAAVVAIILW